MTSMDRTTNGAPQSNGVLEDRRLTAKEAAALAEKEAHSILGVSAEDAFEMLDRGDLAGTAAEAEFSMLRSLLAA